MGQYFTSNPKPDHKRNDKEMTPTPHELADFTGHKILFEDPENKDFVVLKAGNDFVKSFYEQMAIIGHRCKTFKVAQFLSSEDALQGECWWCKAKVPESILTIWKLQSDPPKYLLHMRYPSSPTSYQ